MSAITELRDIDNIRKAQGSEDSPSMVRAILELADLAVSHTKQIKALQEWFATNLHNHDSDPVKPRTPAEAEALVEELRMHSRQEAYANTLCDHSGAAQHKKAADEAEAALIAALTGATE